MKDPELSHLPELGSVSRLIHQFRDGSQYALTLLWHKYQPRLLKLARKFLMGAPMRAVDEEDAVLSAFDSFVRRMENGGYSDLRDREQLWKSLVLLTRNKASFQKRTELRKRCVSNQFSIDKDGEFFDVFCDLVSSEASPHSTVELLDLLNSLLGRLKDRELKRIAVAKLNGYSNSEIAVKLKRSVPTIERRLRLIRAIWNEYIN